MTTTFFAFIVTLCMSPFIYLAYMMATEEMHKRQRVRSAVISGAAQDSSIEVGSRLRVSIAGGVEFVVTGFTVEMVSDSIMQLQLNGIHDVREYSL